MSIKKEKMDVIKKEQSFLLKDICGILLYIMSNKRWRIA